MIFKQKYNSVVLETYNFSAGMHNISWLAYSIGRDVKWREKLHRKTTKRLAS